MLCHVTQVYGMEVRFKINDKHGSSDPGKTSQTRALSLISRS